MDPQRGEATCTTSRARAGTRKVSARSAKGASMKLAGRTAGVDLGVLDAVPHEEQKRGSTRASGTPRKKSAAGSQSMPQVGARGARAKKVPVSTEDFLDGLAGLAEPPEAPEPLLPRVESRREAGAHSAPVRKPPPRADSGSDLLVLAPSLSQREVAAGSWKPKAVLENLRLSRPEISEAADVVNKVVDHLLRRMQSWKSEFQGVELLRTGSYYEHVKVSSPNEFDIMFKLDMPRIAVEEYRNSGAHYLVKFKRNPKGNPLNEFVEKEILSASKMLSKFREIINKEIKNIEDIEISMERKKRGCPAVTLLIKKPKEISVDIILALQVKSSWPASTRKGLPIQDWLGRKVRRDLRRQPFYLVPKPAKEENHFQEDTWRLSFSHIEKDILQNHGAGRKCCEAHGVKCCRKDCLKLMKYLLEQLKKKYENQKELKKFCSYHMKTAFFHICSRNPEDSQWQPKDVKLCFDRCLEFFLECLKIEHLTNYFIPGVNLFSQDLVDKRSKRFLSDKIEYERNNGFPIFKEF